MQSAIDLPTPPPELIELSHTLGERIVHWIHQHGPMPFDRYMQMCLYEPGLGYYFNGLHKFGAGGDFVTAPEQGSLFAQALARHIDQISPEWGDGWVLLELGAGSGVLARDVLLHLKNPPSQYLILEPSAALRDVQAQTLRNAQLEDQVQWLNEPPSETFKGLVLGNEVIDALPVKRWRFSEQGIEELAVSVETHEGVGRLVWTTMPPSQRLCGAVKKLMDHLPQPLPIGYESEILVDLPDWLKTVTNPLSHGVALFIDYGYTNEVYYHPDRTTGTLVCHYRHRAHFDPFIWPGLTDLSAFVDFSALGHAAEAIGLHVGQFATQAQFVLASQVHDSFLAFSDERQRLKALSEFKRLTLPGEMGEKFKVMALMRNQNTPLADFSSSID